MEKPDKNIFRQKELLGLRVPGYGPRWCHNHGWHQDTEAEDRLASTVRTECTWLLGLFPLFPLSRIPSSGHVGWVAPHPWTSSNLENTPTLLPRDLFPWWFKILSSWQARFFITTIYILSRFSICAELSPLRWKFTWCWFFFFLIYSGILGTATGADT